MKKILGGVGTAVAVVAILAFKFLAPSAEVAVKNATGAGWDDAKGDFKAEISQVINSDYEVFVLSQAEKDAITDCIVDKSVEFLNGTDCSYLYNTATTTEAEHLANQEKCMEKVKFPEHQEGFTIECTKTNMPNSWKVMEKIFVGVYEEAYTAQGVAGPKAKQIGECISKKLVALCDARKYELVDKSAKEAEKMFFPIDKYIPDFEKDEEVSAILNECAPAEDAAK
ncbi:MAG: hypothetical protein JXX14_22075 [Deltaproteobacteria bacterium]|nr:hypothetical protein [Deltaproteobacteria bacterium]